MNNSLLGIQGGSSVRFNDTMLLNYSMNRSKHSTSQNNGSLFDSSSEPQRLSLFKKKKNKGEGEVDEIRGGEGLEIIREVGSSGKKKHKKEKGQGKRGKGTRRIRGYLCVNVCYREYKRIYVYMNIWIYEYMNVCMYVCMYVCMSLSQNVYK